MVMETWDSIMEAGTESRGACERGGVGTEGKPVTAAEVPADGEGPTIEEVGKKEELAAKGG